ncbi:MAG TPA: hypothetical protein VD866_30950 [Urbifossiella sp.]|nr:hypothetical protein [Urbifossiella sp.]
MPLTLSPRRTADPAPPHPWLARALAGDIDLPAFAPAALPAAARTAAEADAVARALACPDLFVMDAPDRAARERLIADLARCAALRGERVLVLSPDPLAADRLAETIASDPAVKVVRALADDENPHRPSPAANRLTTAAAGRGRVDGLRRSAEADLRTADADLSAAEALATIAAGLKALADRFAAIEPERGAVAAARDAAPVPEPGSPFAADLERIAAEFDAARRPLLADRAAVTARRAAADSTLAAARQHKADANDPTKKSGFFSRLLHKPKPPVDPAELDRHIADAEHAVKEQADRDAALQVELDAVDRRQAAEVGKRTAAEAVARRPGFEAQLAALAAERDEVAGRFVLAGKELARGGVPAPAQLTPDAAGRTFAELDARRAAAAAKRAAARARLDDLGAAGAELAGRVLAEARVVVGTPGSLASDPVFAVPSADPPFALLILDHAEDVGEADFAQLSPRAGRWVLAGDPMGGSERNGRRGGALLARLARRLDRDGWARDGDRLVVRLLPDAAVTGREPLLDHPDVELRFAAGGALAAIAFPPGMATAAVHRFLADQLGECRPRPCGPVRWYDDGSVLTACWPAAETLSGEWAEVGGGLRLRTAGAFTAAVSFDPAAGWDRAAAEAWLEARVPPPGRVAVVR